ncbi:MAG: histidinol dehydrogenase [Candidatus Omnitrophica bacterium 4484_213]|nr:MAG: histidinol dehydrogenase [Candidatus Omnitrophica bacterium 4484_213]
MEIITYNKNNREKISSLLSYSPDEKISRVVRRVIKDVARNGDKALLRWTKEFDKVKLPLKRIRVSEGDINRAYQRIDCDFIPLLRSAIDNVSEFYKKEKKRSLKTRKNGVVLGRIVHPINRVGIYIPGGSAPLISTVYMSVIPAKLAGVKEIALASPPDEHKEIDAHILVVANLLGIKEIYRVGGAQAIAGLAIGTQTIKKVDKIVGPGNVYVQEAKRQVFGFVDIDMLAGPSEVVIVADESAPTSFVVADLLAQQEHKEGKGILVTTSQRLAEKVKRELQKGWIVLVENIDEAAEVVNLLAPEHLEVILAKAKEFFPLIKNAGAIFVGRYSPVAVGDYFAGPGHILPTQGTARFHSCLGIDSFMKSSHYISYSQKGLEKAREAIAKLSEIEGMPRHKKSVEARFIQGEKAKGKGEV